MDVVKFQWEDASILFCIPERGCDLNSLVCGYTCFERIAIPSYETVAGCLGRAAEAGALRLPINRFYALTEEWFTRIHLRDDEFAASELAMIDFADKLEKESWPAIGATFVLPKAEFDRAAAHTSKYLEELFAPFQKEAKSWWRFW